MPDPHAFYADCCSRQLRCAFDLIAHSLTHASGNSRLFHSCHSLWCKYLTFVIRHFKSCSNISVTFWVLHIISVALPLITACYNLSTNVFIAANSHLLLLHHSAWQQYCTFSFIIALPRLIFHNGAPAITRVMFSNIGYYISLSDIQLRYSLHHSALHPKTLLVISLRVIFCNRCSLYHYGGYFLFVVSYTTMHDIPQILFLFMELT